MSPSKILFFLCISFVLGIFIESVVKIPCLPAGRLNIFIWGFLFTDFLAIIIFLLIRKDVLAIAGFCFLFIILGILRVQISEFNIANDKLSKLNGKDQVVLTGIINDEPDVRDTSQKLKVKVGNSTILVSAYRYPEYKYLDKIKVTGKLESPKNTDTFNYQNYLLKDHIYSVMNFAKVGLISQKHQYNLFSFLYEKILLVKQKLEQSIQNNFLPPHSLILEGIIFGNNKNMTEVLRNQLNAAGLRFLTAISGVHVIILSAILIGFLMFLGLSRIQSSYSSFFLIWLYVVITGFTTSGIRAAIMGSIFIVAGALGRQNTNSRTIVLAAALMLLQNPLLITYDVGFHLSFMACLGIIYLRPSINFFIKKLFKEKFNELADVMAATFSAQIFTLPIMIYNFGVFSLASPITSILILPIMPEILSFGFLFSIFAAVSKFLGWILYLPTWFLIAYFIKTMEIFSAPWMIKQIANVSWVWILFAYAIIGATTYFLNKKYSQNFI